MVVKPDQLRLVLDYPFKRNIVSNLGLCDVVIVLFDEWPGRELDSFVAENTNRHLLNKWKVDKPQSPAESANFHSTEP